MDIAFLCGYLTSPLLCITMLLISKFKLEKGCDTLKTQHILPAYYRSVPMRSGVHGVSPAGGSGNIWVLEELPLWWQTSCLLAGLGREF